MTPSSIAAALSAGGVVAGGGSGVTQNNHWNYPGVAERQRRGGGWKRRLSRCLSCWILPLGETAEISGAILLIWRINEAKRVILAWGWNMAYNGLAESHRCGSEGGVAAADACGVAAAGKWRRVTAAAGSALAALWPAALAEKREEEREEKYMLSMLALLRRGGYNAKTSA